MSKAGIQKITRTVGAVVKKHSPEILTAMGIGGMITSTILAVKATPKAMNIIKETVYDPETYANEPKPGTMDIIKATWKCYIPAAVTCAASVACIVGASTIHTKRNTALAAAYSLTETALKEYQEKVVEVVGEKKAEAVRDSIAKEAIIEKPVVQSEVIDTGDGATLCFDKWSGRYFHSSINKIDKAINALNKEMLNEMYVSLNEFYYELGLDGTDEGEEYGWNINMGEMEATYSSQLTPSGEPCIVVIHRQRPRYDFTSY